MYCSSLDPTRSPAISPAPMHVHIYQEQLSKEGGTCQGQGSGEPNMLCTVGKKLKNTTEKNS